MTPARLAEIERNLRALDAAVPGEGVVRDSLALLAEIARLDAQSEHRKAALIEKSAEYQAMYRSVAERDATIARLRAVLEEIVSEIEYGVGYKLGERIAARCREALES